MLGRYCGIPDERWVDYHLGKLGSAAAEAMERHAESCSVCRGACKHWAELIGMPTGYAGSVPGAAEATLVRDAAEPAMDRKATEATVHRETAEAIVEVETPKEKSGSQKAGGIVGRQESGEVDSGQQEPASSVYRSLRRRMALRALFRRAKRRPGRMAAAFVCAALLGFALIGLFKYPATQEEPVVATSLEARHYARIHVPEGARLMELPGTRVISSTDIAAAWPVPASAIKPRRSLTVWINADTKELFVLLEGVVESDASDVQAWADSSSRLMNLGLLEFHSGQGHLYSRFREMAPPDVLRFTIEPKGGSELPTTPDSALVRLARVEE